MNSRAFSLGWSHLRCAPRPPSLLPLAFCSFIFFALAFLGERDAPGSKELQRLVAGLQPRSMQLSPHLRGLIQHQHHPVAPLGAAFLLHRACTHQAGSGTAPAAASPGSSGGKTGQPCQPLRPLRRGSPLLRHRGMGPSDPPPPPLARAAGWIRTGPCWGNQHHLQLFLAFLSQFLQIWGRVGVQSSTPYLNRRCSCKSRDFRKELAAPPLVLLAAPSSSMPFSTRCTSGLPWPGSPG